MAQPALLSNILFISNSLGQSPARVHCLRPARAQTGKVQHQIRPVTRDNIKMKSGPYNIWPVTRLVPAINHTQAKIIQIYVLYF